MNNNKNLATLVSFTFSLGITFSPLFSVKIIAQESCETALTEAQGMYDAGRFAQVIERLNLCLPDQIPKEHGMSVYRLLAICYLNEDYPEKARVAIRKIFDLNRQYQPDVQDPQPYRDMAGEVKASLPKSLGEKLFGGVRKWVWISAASFAIGALVLTPPPEQDLPGPPPLP